VFSAIRPACDKEKRAGTLAAARGEFVFAGGGRQNVHWGFTRCGRRLRLLFSLLNYFPGGFAAAFALCLVRQSNGSCRDEANWEHGNLQQQGAGQ
jgi:hypothetical protein